MLNTGRDEKARKPRLLKAYIQSINVEEKQDCKKRIRMRMEKRMQVERCQNPLSRS